jgi:carboxypeptidase C (cathepsin A)
MRTIGVWLLVLAAPSILIAQQRQAAAPDSARPAAPVAMTQEQPPVVTRHQITIRGNVLRYTVTTGYMPVKNDQGTIEGQMFFMAYTLDGAEPGSRPLMFSFNGGPGSSSVWLHLGALGPRRVRMEEEGWMPAAPYRLVDNEHTWLEFTDLVFIDPIGTGFSRAATQELGRKFWSFRGDIESVGHFIRMYLGRHERWSSPLFLVGESYGTTRAAGLSRWLIDHGIGLNGVVLVSTILNFQTARFGSGNDLPYALFVPLYTATAWYHQRLDRELQTDLRRTLELAERWVDSSYTLALQKGDALTPEERRRTAEQLARFTGLSREFIERYNLRISLGVFQKELLRDQGRTVGRLDSRFTGWDATAGGETPEFDPSMTAIRPPYTAAFNDYVRRELGFKSDLEYYILGGGIGPWTYDSDNAFADIAEQLRSAWARNPHMRLFVASGYYDGATPYYAAEYTLRHMRLPPDLKTRISTGYYEAGHMMYIQMTSLERLTGDIRNFVRSATMRQ